MREDLDRVRNQRGPGRPPDPTGVRRSAFVRGTLGTGDGEVTIPADTRAIIAQRLGQRLIAARDLQKDRKRLGTFERLMLSIQGKAIIEKFQGSGELTVDGLAAAWAILHDELLQKTGAVAKTVIQNIEREEKPSRFKRRLFRNRSSSEVKAATTRVIPSQEPILSSDYIQKLGFTEWREQDIEKDIVELNNARVALEQSLGMAEVWTVPDFQREKGEILHDAVAKQVEKILEREHGGKTYVALKNEDPFKAVQVRHAALQEGLMRFSSTLAKDLLKAERPAVDIAAIQAYAKELPTGLSGDSKQADALEQWERIGTTANYEKIIDEAFAQKEDGEFARARLADISIQAGQMTGADLIREHIFGVLDPKVYGSNEQKELVRKMLSDEAISRSIIEIFRIDISQGTIAVGTGTYTYTGLLTEVRNKRTAVETAERALREQKSSGTIGTGLMAYENAVRDSRNELQRHEQSLLQSLLPYLKNATRFQVGDTLLFMIQQGLQSAAHGDPYLKVSPYFEKQQAELRLTPAGLLSENMGRVEFGRSTANNAPETTWVGSLRNIHAGGILGGLNTAGKGLDFRIIQNFDRNGKVTSVIQIQVNDEFFHTLPATFQTGVTPDFVKPLYDSAGNKRTEVRRTGERNLLNRPLQIPDWIDVTRGGRLGIQANTLDDMLDYFRDSLSNQADIKITSAAANEILSKNRADILRIAAAFHDVNVAGVTLNGAIKDYQISLGNNGYFWIQNISDGDKPEELKAFYDRRLEDFKRAEGVQTLSTEQHQELQGELLKIQSAVGREILRGQRYK